MSTAYLKEDIINLKNASLSIFFITSIEINFPFHNNGKIDSEV